MARSSRKAAPRKDRSRTLISAGLFLALGLVGAFIVSAVAGLHDDEPAATGLRAFGRGIADPSSVRVEVLNGAGAAGLARDATHQLRGAGFDVVFFGNAGRFDHARSVVLDRTGQIDRAEAVAAALGIDSVASDPDSVLMLEVTVVLGGDWPPAPRPEPGWGERLREMVERDAAPAGRGAADPAPADTAPADPTGG